MDKSIVMDAMPGERIHVRSGEYAGTWLRIEDADPPYIEGTWVEVVTGRVCPHWSYLWAALENE